MSTSTFYQDIDQIKSLRKETQESVNNWKLHLGHSNDPDVFLSDFLGRL